MNTSLDEAVQIVTEEAARIEARLTPMHLDILCSGDDVHFFPTVRADYRVVTK